MSYLLDTNACVTHLRSAGESALSRRLAEQSAEDIKTCSIVKAELIYGALRSREAGKNLAQVHRFLSPFESLSFDDLAAAAYGRIRCDLEERGTPIGPNDLMISAISVAHDVTLVTHNTAEFGRVPGLKIEDWQAAP